MMTKKSLLHFFVLSLALLLTTASAHAELPANQVFEQLKSLVGTWENKNSSGHVLKVNYRLTAVGSVLVETWTMSPERESMTLYHMDDQALIATHYCPIGNQPTLQLKSVTGSLFKFEFRSATNLPDSKAAHEHLFEVELLDNNKYRRKETYLENGEAGSDDLVFTRVK
jgi:hypothetical protein